MEGFILLLLQMALLLLAAAVVFFLLGWRWRGQDVKRAEQKWQQRLEAEAGAVKAASNQCAETQQKLQDQESTYLRLQAEVQEAADHRRNLERELIRVHEDLKSARQMGELDREEAKQARDDLKTAQEHITQLTENLEKALHQITQQQADIAKLQTQTTEPSLESTATTPAAPEPVVEVAKPKRIRKAATEKIPADIPAIVKKTRAKKVERDVRSTLTKLESDLLTKQTFLNALRQELDDWQRRVSALRIKGNDPAGLGLATKSLNRAEAQVSAAAAEVEHLQHQQTTLTNSLQQATSLTHEDDLTLIKGIKSVLRDQLHVFGIRTFRQIAEWTDQDVESFSELLAFKDRAKRDEWVKQARDLM
jgi:predicted flap endonuclease-1-like 5' DNA nuclease